MKLSAVAVSVFLALTIIAVAFTASVKNYAASDSAPVDWKEHASKANRRSMGCAGCASMENDAEVLTKEKRTMECAGCPAMGDNAGVQPVKKLSPNPMSPYLSLKPFLPVKPTFVPPFVDPNYFINKKADLLNNLFAATNIESSDPSVQTKKDSVDEPVNLVQPRFASFSPFLPLSPTEKPTIVPPEYWMPMSGPGIVDPASMIDKKTKFLNTLFSKIASPDSSVAARSVASEDITSDVSSAEGAALSPDFWLQFLPYLTTPEPPTAKPTIVPPGFWIPSSIGKTPAKPFSPKVPIVNPSEFIDKKTTFLNTLFKTLNITVTPTTETTTAPVPDPISAYQQKVVFPMMKPTVVPPGYWMPMSGPGILDPATMIDKKTKFLNTLFSNIAASDSSVSARAVVPEDASAKQSAVPSDFWLQFLPSFTTPEPPTVKPTIVPPGFWIPSSASKIPAKPFGPKIPVIDPSEFIDKKTTFLNTLFKTLNITLTPSTDTTPESTPDPVSAYQKKEVSPTIKPTVVPPGYWMPMSGPGIVDPATMIDKKTKFLNTLFSNIAASDSSVSARAVIPEDASTTKQSAIPSDFWLQFLPSFTTPEPPALKPTIVPPGFWIPSSLSKIPAKPFGPKIPVIDPSEFIDKKTAFLNTLFKTLNITLTPSTDTTPESTPDPISAYQKKEVSPTMKPTVVPPGYWMPMSGPGIVDPATMIDKKTKFLNTLFSNITASDSSVSARAVVPEDASTTKQSVIPSDFWLQFLPSFTTPEPPTVKPTIVPPGFWIPSSVNKIPSKPFGPKIPVIDPSEFIDKKTAFLNTLFKTLNITIAPRPITTPEPTPDPMMDFLDKLLSSAVNNSIQQSTLKRSMTEEGDNVKTANSNSLSNKQGPVNAIPKVTRQSAMSFNKRSTTTEDNSDQSPMPLDTLLDTKDRLMNIIMGELSSIKNNILDTITQLLAQQKEAAAVSALAASKKKFGPGGPFGPWGAALLKATPKPAPDPTPFQNKVEFLSQMFDALTKLEKDVGDALNEAINESFSQSTASSTATSMVQETNSAALLQLIRTKLSELANDGNNTQVPVFSRAISAKGFTTSLPTPKPTIVEPSFLIPKVTPGTAVDPTFFLSKTKDFLSKLFASKTAGTSVDSSKTSAYEKERSIKMTVHQGYQSLPPGTEELLQAGGGSNSMDHEGGGLKLQDDRDPLWAIPSDKEGHHHHHNHHNK